MHASFQLIFYLEIAGLGALFIWLFLTVGLLNVDLTTPTVGVVAKADSFNLQNLMPHRFIFQAIFLTMAVLLQLRVCERALTSWGWSILVTDLYWQSIVFCTSFVSLYLASYRYFSTWSRWGAEYFFLGALASLLWVSAVKPHSGLTVLLLLELINVVILAIVLLSSSCFDASGAAVRASATTKANVAAVARFILFFLWVAALAAVLIFFACGVSFANNLVSSLMTDQLNFQASAATQYLSPVCLFVGLSLKLGLAPAQFVVILLYRTFTVSTLFNYLVFYYVYSIWVGAWLFVYAFGLSGALGIFFLIGTLVVWVLLSTVELSEDTRQMLALSTLVNFIVLYSAVFLCFVMMFLKAAKSVGMAFATVPLAGCAVGLGLVFGSFLRGTSYSPDMEDTLFSHAMLGFALIETFMVVALGLVGLIYAL